MDRVVLAGRLIKMARALLSGALFIERDGDKFRLNGKGGWVSERRMDRQVSDLFDGKKYPGPIPVKEDGKVVSRWEQDAMGHRFVRAASKPKVSEVKASVSRELVVIARELLKTAKTLVAKDKYFLVNHAGTYTLWRAYAPGSGSVTVFKGLPTGYITDKSSDKNFDINAKTISRAFPKGKVIQLDVYDYRDGDQKNYKVFGGDVKPSKRLYMVVSKQKDVVVNFFDKKGEAAYWAKNTPKEESED